MKTKPQTSVPKGREPLQWLVVNPEGKLLAILDSESEAYWFIRNRGHAYGAEYFKSPTKYDSAPELISLVKRAEVLLREFAGEDPGECMTAGSPRGDACELADEIQTALAETEVYPQRRD